MTIVTGGGTGNETAWDVLSGVFTIVSYSDTGFTLRSMAGDITAVGTGLAFTVTESAPNVPVITVTAGVITGVTIGTGAGQNTWSGFGSVSAVTAFSRISSNDKAGFYSLFFGGNDTFNISNGAANPGMYGFDGNDTFNVSTQGTGLVDGGAGDDTLNISNGVGNSFGNSFFNVSNVEHINLAAGFDYYLNLTAALVYAGNTTTIDGSALGPGNKLILDNSSSNVIPNLNTFTGNLTALGGAGDDFFQGGSGSNIFNGGSGNDTVSFHIGTPVGYVFSGTVGVTANLNNLGAQWLGGPRGGIATFISIENLIGTKLNDTLTGDAGANILNGDDGGDDIFNGRGGDDTIIGGLGNDTAIYSGLASNYTITHTPGTITTTISGPDGTDTLTGIDWAQFGDQAVQISGITLTTSNVSAQHAQNLLLSNLVTASDVEGLQTYQYQLFDGDADPASGHWVVNGTAQAARTVITVTSYDSVYFVTGLTNDHLQIRASDGRHWSAPDNAGWAPFTVTVPINHAPVVTTSNVTQRQGQSVSASTLFQVSDPDTDNMTSYQFFDGTFDPSSGYFVLNGQIQAARTVITVSSAASLSYVAGTVIDNLQVRASDGGLWSAPDNAGWAPFTVTPQLNHAPVVTTTNVAAGHGQSIPLSSLLTVTDADNDTITAYQIFDGTGDPTSGHFEYAGTVLPQRSVIDVSQYAIGNIYFVTGAVADTIQIRASDGTSWSAADNAAWAPFTISVPVNHAPVVTTAPITVQHNQVISTSSLFTISDPDNDTITRYQLFDGTADPNSGHFITGNPLNNQVLPERTVIDLTAAQFNQISYVSGTSVSDNLQIRVFDGASWSAPDNAGWSPFTVTVVPNHAPVVSTSTFAATQHGQAIPVSSLITVSDADNDTITKYQLYDGNTTPGSGYFAQDGIIQYPAGTVIDVPGSELYRWTFVTGAVNDNLQIRAYDGGAWSAPDNAGWSPFTVTVPANHAPVVTTSNVAAQHGQTIALSSLFNLNDVDGDSAALYQLFDGTSDPLSGHFVNNYNPYSPTAFPERSVFTLTAYQASWVSFVTGFVSDNLQIRVFDGGAWSAPDNAGWAPFTVTVPVNHAPVVSTANTASSHGQTIALSSLITVTDAENDPVTRYQLFDGTADPNSGHFVINGVAQAERSIIDIAGSQLAQTSFVTGFVSDNLQIRAFDGAAWSAADNAAWSPFTLSVPANHAPVVATSTQTFSKGQSIALSSLITTTDADGDAITKYQLFDGTSDPNSGHFVINGVPQSERTILNITASQLAFTSFVTGIGTIGDDIQVRAFDGFAWSAPDNASWSPFHINVT